MIIVKRLSSELLTSAATPPAALMLMALEENMQYPLYAMTIFPV